MACRKVGSKCLHGSEHKLLLEQLFIIMILKFSSILSSWWDGYIRTRDVKDVGDGMDVYGPGMWRMKGMGWMYTDLGCEGWRGMGWMHTNLRYEEWSWWDGYIRTWDVKDEGGWDGCIRIWDMENTDLGCEGWRGWAGCIRTWDVKDEADGMGVYGPGIWRMKGDGMGWMYTDLGYEGWNWWDGCIQTWDMKDERDGLDDQAALLSLPRCSLRKTR